MASKKTKVVKTLAEVQKGDTVYLYMFSGAAVGRNGNEYEVASCSDKSVTIETGRGMRKFSRTTGVQIGAENPRYANFILAQPDDNAKAEAVAAVKAAAEKGKPTKEDKKAEKLKAKGKKAAPEIDEDEFEDADDEEKKPAKKEKAKSTATKAPAKSKNKKAKEPEPEDEDDDLDDDEE